MIAHQHERTFWGHVLDAVDLEFGKYAECLAGKKVKDSSCQCARG
jgi:hypothetical protein